jgi:hypothetical protein
MRFDTNVRGAILNVLRCGTTRRQGACHAILLPRVQSEAGVPARISTGFGTRIPTKRYMRSQNM